MEPTCHAYYCMDRQDIEEYGTSEAVHEAMVIRCKNYYRTSIRPLGVVMGKLFCDGGERDYRKALLLRTGGQELNAALKPGDHVVFTRFETVFKSLSEVGNLFKLLTDRGVHVHVAGATGDPSLWQFYINWCCDLSHRIASRVSRTRYIDRTKSDPHFPVRDVHKDTGWIKKRRTGKWTVYVRNDSRFSQALLALRLLAEGNNYSETAQLVEAQRRADEGLPHYKKKYEQTVWHPRSVHRLAHELAKYLPIMRTYYGERDEYYLNLTPDLSRGQKPIPPIPRPVEISDEPVDTKQHTTELDVVLPRDSPDHDDPEGVPEGASELLQTLPDMCGRGLPGEGTSRAARASQTTGN